MSEFVEGVYVKAVQTKYGEIIKQSFDCEKFIEFMRANAKQSEKNGRWYFNADILTTKDSGKKYMAVDDFVPQKQPPQAQQSAPEQTPPVPPPKAPPMHDNPVF